MIRLAGLPADLEQVSKSEVWWKEAWIWIATSEAFFWWIIGILFLWILIFEIAPFLPTWLASFWHNKERYARLMEEHDSLYHKRAKYWGDVKAKYNGWAANNGLPDMALENLIERAEFPTVTKARQNVHSWVQSLTGESKSLYDFCQNVLASVKECEPDDSAFKDAQAVLSNYWLKVGAAIFDEKEISRKKVYNRDFPHQSRLIKLLAYFECAVEVDLNSRKIRKPYLFDLYLDAQKRGLTYEHAKN